MWCHIFTECWHCLAMCTHWPLKWDHLSLVPSSLVPRPLTAWVRDYIPRLSKARITCAWGIVVVLTGSLLNGVAFCLPYGGSYMKTLVIRSVDTISMKSTLSPACTGEWGVLYAHNLVFAEFIIWLKYGVNQFIPLPTVLSILKESKTEN